MVVAVFVLRSYWSFWSSADIRVYVRAVGDTSWISCERYIHFSLHGDGVEKRRREEEEEGCLTVMALEQQ